MLKNKPEEIFLQTPYLENTASNTMPNNSNWYARAIYG